MKSIRSQDRTRRRVGWLVACVLPLLAGCRPALFTGLMWGPATSKTVPAEYPYLRNQTLCILVRAEPETLFEFPHVQWEVADHVRIALEANVKGLKVVDCKQVADFQQRDATWAKMDPAAIGKRFGADRVLEIDLTQYTTRDPDSPHIHRGHVHGVLSIFQVKFPDHEPSYTADIRTFYPPTGTGEWAKPERVMRRQMMEAFAQDVANKFYEREVPLDNAPQ